MKVLKKVKGRQRYTVYHLVSPHGMALCNPQIRANLPGWDVAEIGDIVAHQYICMNCRNIQRKQNTPAPEPELTGQEKVDIERLAAWDPELAERMRERLLDVRTS